MAERIRDDVQTSAPAPILDSSRHAAFGRADIQKHTHPPAEVRKYCCGGMEAVVFGTAANNMRTEIIVTGANGFIGRHTARLMAKSGYFVTGIGHGSWMGDEWRAWGLSRWVRSDVTVETLRRSAGAPYAILHCAGGSSVPFSVVNPLKDFERTVATTANILEFVRVYSPATRVVYPSSASVYGATGTSPIKEDTPSAPISPYGVHKVMAEQLVTSYARQYGISSAILRLFSVYGCGLRKQLLWDACNKMASGNYTFMGTGNELRDWLNVEDAARLIRSALGNSGTDCPVINGGTGIGISVRAIVQALAVCSRSEIVPAFLDIGRQGDPAALVADTTLSATWGWKPTCSLSDGLDGYVAWWQSQHVPAGNQDRQCV